MKAKVPSVGFTVGEAISQVAVHEPYAAVACGCFVQLVRVDGDQVTTECSLEVRHGTSSSFTITDVAFSPASPERLAVSTTNGAVVVFNTALCPPPIPPTASSSSSSSSSRVEEWRHADESSRAIHKVAWHGSAVDVLAAACAEGTVKVRLWSAWTCVNALVLAHIQAHQPPLYMAVKVRLLPAYRCVLDMEGRPHPRMPSQSRYAFRPPGSYPATRPRPPHSGVPTHRSST